MKLIKYLHKFKLVDYLEVLVKLGGEAIWTMALLLSISKITFHTSSSVKGVVRKVVLLIGNLSDVICSSLIKSEIALLWAQKDVYNIFLYMICSAHSLL
jgi:hypothetical protein